MEHDADPAHLGQFRRFAERRNLLRGVDAERRPAAVRLDGLVGVACRPGKQIKEPVPETMGLTLGLRDHIIIKLDCALEDEVSFGFHSKIGERK